MKSTHAEHPPQLDDARLLAGCLAGDEAAWRALVERYTRLVYSIAFKSGLAEPDAADLVQDVFTIVLRRLEALQHVERFSSWLITVTNREAWRMKKARTVTLLPEGLDAPDTAPSLESQVVAWEQAASVQAALGRIDERCRRLLEMLFLHEPRPHYEEIGQTLGIAVGSIGPIRARCLGRLRDRLAAEDALDGSRQDSHGATRIRQPDSPSAVVNERGS